MTDVWLTGYVHPIIKGGVVCSLRHQGVIGCRGGVYRSDVLEEFIYEEGLTRQEWNLSLG